MCRSPILERLSVSFSKRKEPLVNRVDCLLDFFLNFGGFTLSGRLPVRESNQFLYAVSKALPVCCSDCALTSCSHGISVLSLVSSRLRWVGRRFDFVNRSVLRKSQKMVVHKPSTTKLTCRRSGLLRGEVHPPFDALFDGLRPSSGSPHIAG